jgi:hypothetical protein
MKMVIVHHGVCTYYKLCLYLNLNCFELNHTQHIFRAVTAQSVQRLGYGLDNRGTRVRFLSGAGNFSLHHRVKISTGAHSASYPGGTRGSFNGNKLAGAEN